MHRNQGAARGFSLIELAIVIVIIGLIVGAILVGGTLTRNAEIKSAITQIEKFKQATVTFKLKYNGLPGDSCDAQKYGFSTRTCANIGQGDSNGILQDRLQASADSQNVIGEEYVLYWNDMVRAGIIGEKLDATLTDANWNCYNDSCRPLSRINSALYAIVDIGNKNFYFLGNDPTSTALKAIGTITPTQAKMWDEKSDDAAPSSGAFSTVLAGGPINMLAADVPGATGCSASASTYNLAGSYADQAVCAIIIRMTIN